MAKSAAAKWLAGDTTYQQQSSNFKKSKSDYESQYKRQKGITERDYAEMVRSMNRQGTADRDDQQNDFAGRGFSTQEFLLKLLEITILSLTRR